MALPILVCWTLTGPEQEISAEKIRKILVYSGLPQQARVQGF
jgi:hypothetical protein